MTNFFNPAIFLEVARRLKDHVNLDDQGKIRTVIGRVYYAAFLTTREYLKKYKGRNFSKERQHQDVIDALDDLNEYDLKNWLETLRDNRISADYCLNITLDIGICEKCLNISNEIINSIEGF